MVFHSTALRMIDYGRGKVNYWRVVDSGVVILVVTVSGYFEGTFNVGDECN